MEEKDEYRFNISGYDIRGYNKEGYDINGYNLQGYDKEGYNIHGYDKEGFHKITKKNQFGLTKMDYTFNETGLNKQAYETSINNTNTQQKPSSIGEKIIMGVCGFIMIALCISFLLYGSS